MNIYIMNGVNEYILTNIMNGENILNEDIDVESRMNMYSLIEWMEWVF